jgi:glyoxylase-like metal-dependent hydrolase (beta-lactamase superfamily II)
MRTWLCTACGTQYPPAESPPERCPICEDPRQYVPQAGQAWTELAALRAAHRAEIRDDHGILGIGCTPEFAIGQRALLVPGAEGNVLWDCIPLLDDEIAARVEAEGGLAAIAVCHPHFYTAMVEWAHAFDARILIHHLDREWVMRPDPAVEVWRGPTYDLGGGRTLVHCGGHFAGAQVLHWAERRALLTGDIVTVVPDRTHVSFMYSYPNLIPLPAAAVERIGRALESFDFETIHGGWWGRVVERDGKSVVRRSVDRYVRAVTGGLEP